MDDLSNKLGSELGTIIVNQAATISKLKILLEKEHSKNAELQLQVKALRKDDKHGRSDSKHK
ncbi:hypothetical protein [Lactobacillus crispatus]|uniref:hypothetical protein n=1 Tax=Lactobacillus crispatus TaxID=47770 RepID=UPI00195657E9|nr:hypothetical protein [Lactobacillus crispatus]MBM6873505.1 hypothetical protein [Lactobacillus crispatus]